MAVKRTKRAFSVPVLEHLPNGKVRRRYLKREHMCNKKCLRKMRMFGLTFSWCARYSYAG